ncbi:MAG TPA: InlB B-repeat-containing protein, partial [Acidimicrobiales bacterium]|nr:InlB B-repeat-containing protein [Acidimicrobiales bacterium]
MSKILTEKNRRSVGRYILSGLLMIVFLAGLGATSASATTVILPTVQVVTFYENASAGDPVVTFESSDTAQNLTMENSLNPAFVNSGSTFVGWNTSPDGTGTPFADGAPYTFAIDLPLFAQWAVLPVVHTVTFYQNDNSLDHVVAFVNGTIPGSLTQFGSLNPTFVKADSSFVDWNTAANGTGMAYANGA